MFFDSLISFVIFASREFLASKKCHLVFKSLRVSLGQETFARNALFALPRLLSHVLAFPSLQKIKILGRYFFFFLLFSFLFIFIFLFLIIFLFLYFYILYLFILCIFTTPCNNCTTPRETAGEQYNSIWER